jgi:hypothetical protein
MKLNKKKEWTLKLPITDVASESQNYFDTQSLPSKINPIVPQHCEIYPHDSPNNHE